VPLVFTCMSVKDRSVNIIYHVVCNPVALYHIALFTDVRDKALI